MKNKIIASLLVVLLLITMTACNKNSKLYNYDLTKYLELGDYSGLDVTYEDQEVSEEDIDLAINGILEAAAQPEKIMSGKAYNGDTVNIDFTGTIDGKVFDGGTASDQTLKLGSKQMIEGFEEQIIGKDLGSTFVIDVTFPKEYHSEALRSKDAKFEIHLNYKHGDSIVPKFSEDFVRNNSDFDTVEEYKEELKAQILSEKELGEEDRVRTEIWTKIVSASKVISYPPKEVKRKIDQSYDYYKSYAEYYGMDFPEFLESYIGMDEEGFADYLDQQAEIVVKQEMVLFSISKEQAIDISDDEYKAGILEMVKKEGFNSLEEFEKAYGQAFEKFAGKENIMITLLLEKVMDYLVDLNLK